MGLIKKFSSKSSSKLAAAAPGGTKVAPADIPSEYASIIAEPDDEPNIFTTFMVIYLGFFGLTLLTYPYMFAASWNPMPYWTAMSDELAFAFRISGGAFLCLILGPFLDDIFGGPGVVMKAFSRQMLIVNSLTFLIFLYYTFYAPIDTAVNITWQGQTYLSGLVLAWNIIEVAGTSIAFYYNLFVTVFFGFFGIGLMLAPATMFGPGLSPMVYWNTWTDLSIFCARSLGFSIVAAAILGYISYGAQYGAGLAKFYVVFNFINLLLFIIPSYFGGASAAAAMWELQLAVQVPIVLVGLYLAAAGYAGSWTCVSLLPKCGNNLGTFNFINFLWYLPFVAGFFTFPDELFGPGAISGIPLIVVPIDETALWFCKAWANTMILLVLAPYIFGLPALKVAKQVTFTYIAFVGLFAYALTQTDIFNPLMAYPLAGMNALLFIWGIVLTKPGEGEPLL